MFDWFPEEELSLPEESAWAVTLRFLGGGIMISGWTVEQVSDIALLHRVGLTYEAEQVQ
jgi:hypothetical protein